MHQNNTYPNNEPQTEIERLQFALDAAGIGTWDLDTINNTVTCDEKCRELFGFGPGEKMTYDESMKYLHPADVPAVHAATMKALDPANEGAAYEVRFRTTGAPDGRERWILSKGKAYFNKDNIAYRFAGTVQDITEAIQEREKTALFESTAHLAIENSNSGYFLVTLDTGKIEYSPGYARVITGEYITDMQRVDFLKHIHPEDLPIRDKAMEMAAQTGRVSYEARFIWNDGTIHTVRAIGSYLNDTTGKPYLLAGTVYDTTPERMHTEAVKEAEDLLSTSFNSASVGMAFTDFSGKFLKVNAAYCDLVGYTGEELLAGSYRHITHPDDREYNEELYHDLVSGKRKFFNLTKRYIHKHGHHVWVQMNVTRIAGDNKGRMIAIVRDISAEVEGDKELVAAQAMFGNVANSAPTGLWLSDEEGGLTYLNKTLADWTGMPYADLLGAGWANAIIEEDRQRSAEVFLAAVAARAHYDVQFRMKKGDGSVVWCRAAGDPYYREDGSYAGYAGYCMDIDELVAGKAALQENEARFRSLVEEAPVATALFMGREIRIAIANEKMISYWGKDTSVIGKTLEEALPELAGQPFLQILDDVYTTGLPYEARAAYAELVVDGVMGSYYFDFTFKPLKNSMGQVYAIMEMAVDVTVQVAAQKQLEESQQQLMAYFEQSPVAIAIISEDNLTFRLVNPFYAELVGRTPEDIINKPLLTALPELEGQGFDDLLKSVIATGIPYLAKDVPVALQRMGRSETIYVNLTYQPRREADNTISGVLVVATDVTEQVLARRAIEESESRFRVLIEEAPVATCLFVGREMRIEIANEIMTGYWNKDSRVIGKPLAEAVPELVGQPFLKILDEVYTTGNTYQETAAAAQLLVNGKLKTTYFDYTYKPLHNTAGEVYAVLDMAVDVTEQVLARKALEESELFSRSIFNNSPVAKLVFTGEDMVIRTVNENMLAMLGRDMSIIGMPCMQAMPELRGSPLMERLKHVYATGETYHQPEEKIVLIKDGQPETGYYNYIYKALHNIAGDIYGIMVTATEVTEQTLARQKVEEAELAMRGAIELAQLGTWSVNLAAGTFDYSDRLREWFGMADDEVITIDKAFNAIREQDRPVVKAAVRKALMLPNDGFNDLEFYVKPHGAAKERILHAQGKTLHDEDGVAYKISGTVQDITIQRQQQLALEQQVQLRTEELAVLNEELQSVNEELSATNEELNETNDNLMHSNEELAQYAYVASHDLQEPLRKIIIFSDMLGARETLAAADRALVQKVMQSAERMSVLIRSLLEFSRLLKSDTLMRPVDLTDVVKDVTSDFELAVVEKHAVVHIGKLPAIEAVGLQMNQLFYNLVGNALKFVRPGVPPVIDIDGVAISHAEAGRYIDKPHDYANYYHITVADNGIGFEIQYAEQIFEVFKRLHGRDIYPGSGIGLALCRRIVANHSGHMYVESEVGKGTTFHIILPDKTNNYQSIIPDGDL